MEHLYFLAAGFLLGSGGVLVEKRLLGFATTMVGAGLLFGMMGAAQMAARIMMGH